MSSSTERPESLGQALDTRDGPASQEPERDPWFEPAARHAPAEPSPAADQAEAESEPAAAAAEQPADGEADVAAGQWFMRTGRAGLLPESMTEEPPEPGTGNLPRITSSGSAPPWAAEPAETADGLPPPWESGPWGIDGTGRAGGSADPQLERPAGARRGFTATSAAQAGTLAGGLPGGLRLGGRTSWVAAGALTIVAVVVLIVAVGGGKSADPGCTAYQASGQASYAAVVADLNARAPASALAARLRVAIKRVNLAAAQARQASVQADLAALTSDMQTALADATRTPIPAQVQQAMRRDANSAAAACRS